MTRKLSTLCLANSFKLMKLIEAEYSSKAMTDAQFATYASEKLGFVVNHDHIFNRRVQLDIPATRTINSVAKKADSATMFELVRALEQQVAMLEKAIGMDGKGAKV